MLQRIRRSDKHIRGGIPLEAIKSQIKVKNINNIHDKILKFIATNNIKAFLKVFGLDGLKFKEFLNAEIIDYTLHQNFCDIVFMTEDERIIILEFQSTKLKKEDKIRFGDYQTSLHRREDGKEVIVIVISLHELEENYENYGYDEEYMYRINKRSTICFDTEETIRQLEEHVKKNSIDREDLVKLQLLTYMEEKPKERKRLLKISVGITNIIKNLSKKDKYELNMVQIALAQHYFEGKELYELLGEINMDKTMHEYGMSIILEVLEAKNENLEKSLKEKDEKLKEIKILEEKNKQLKETIKILEEKNKQPKEYEKERKEIIKN